MEYQARPYVYVSGALTVATPERRDELRARYELIGRICREEGLAAYIPHLVSDPVRQAHWTPDQIDDLDRYAVMRSRLVIAYVDDPAHGCGIEVEMAVHAYLPVWLVCRKSLLEARAVSRLIRGSPAHRNQPLIAFDNEEDMERQLREHLQTFIGKMTSGEMPELLRFQSDPNR